MKKPSNKKNSKHYQKPRGGRSGARMNNTAPPKKTSQKPAKSAKAVKPKKQSRPNGASDHTQVIQCLSCIYGDYHLTPYKMGVFKN